MATILEFRSERSAGDGGAGLPDRNDGVSAPSSAQIIIFPGVRIERYEDETPVADGKKNAGRVAKRASAQDSQPV